MHTQVYTHVHTHTHEHTHLDEGIHHRPFRDTTACAHVCRSLSSVVDDAGSYDHHNLSEEDEEEEDDDDGHETLNYLQSAPHSR
jgi:hypothetical protein